MSGAVLVGDQLILEEEYDDDYIPSEQGMQSYKKDAFLCRNFDIWGIGIFAA